MLRGAELAAPRSSTKWCCCVRICSSVLHTVQAQVHRTLAFGTELLHLRVCASQAIATSGQLVRIWVAPRLAALQRVGSDLKSKSRFSMEGEWSLGLLLSARNPPTPIRRLKARQNNQLSKERSDAIRLSSARFLCLWNDYHPGGMGMEPLASR